jgi:hypothetical protein
VRDSHENFASNEVNQTKKLKKLKKKKEKKKKKRKCLVLLSNLAFITISFYKLM